MLRYNMRLMRIALITPSSPARPDEVLLGLDRLYRIVREPLPIPLPRKPHLFLAGRDDERFNDLKRVLEDAKVDALVAVRGGAGAMRLLPMLKGVRPRGDKILVGSSDLTYLGLALWKKFGIPFCHGPMLARLAQADFSSAEAAHLKLALNRRTLRYPKLRGTWAVKEGAAKGTLMGGNLTLLASLIGTPYLPSLDGAILFLEDVNEPLFRLDRLLQTLHQRGILQKAAGVVFGRMEGCFAPFGPREWRALLKEYFDDAPYPVMAGFPSGHGKPQFPLWIGGPAELDSRRRNLVSHFPGKKKRC
jgi:muramoyltetrapeptide carboxypeptidase